MRMDGSAVSIGNYTTTGSGTVIALATSPSLVTPALGVATATSLAIGGATIGSNGLAVTGTSTISGSLAIGGATIGSNALAVTGAVAISGALSIGNTINVVSPTSPNRTITFLVGSTTLYVAAKTTDD